MNDTLIILIILVILFVPATMINRFLGFIVGLASFLFMAYLQTVAIDVAIDVTEDLNLFNIEENFCPNEFNRTTYCVELGVNQRELTGQAFLSHPVSEYVDLKFETKDKLLTCKLTKDKMCNFAEIKSAKDLKITLTDKFGTTIVTYAKIKSQLKKASWFLGAFKSLKKLPIKAL